MKTLQSQANLTLQLTDTQVVRKVISGETELFEMLMRRYNQTLYRVIRGYIHDEDDVMDVMQETYLKAFYKIDQFKSEARFSTWLIRIGINEALQWLRKSKKIVQMKSSLNELHDLKRYQRNTVTPETSAIQNEMKLLLEKAISQIGEKYRVVFILCEVEKLPQQEVADCLNISVSNVKVRLHRAKSLIKDQMFNLSNDNTILEFGNKKCDAVVAHVMKRIS